MKHYLWYERDARKSGSFIFSNLCWKKEKRTEFFQWNKKKLHMKGIFGSGHWGSEELGEENQQREQHEQRHRCLGTQDVSRRPRQFKKEWQEVRLDQCRENNVDFELGWLILNPGLPLITSISSVKLLNFFGSLQRGKYFAYVILPMFSKPFQHRRKMVSPNCPKRYSLYSFPLAFWDPILETGYYHGLFRHRRYSVKYFLSLEWCWWKC